MYKHLLEVCNTERQKDIINRLISGSSQADVAKQIGISRRSVERNLQKLRTKHELESLKSHLINSENPSNVKNITRTTTLIKNENPQDGEPVLQWVRENHNVKEQAEVLKEFAEALKEDLPVYKKPKKHKNTMLNGDLLNCYVISDYHLGLVAFESMTGDEDWDTTKAEEILYKWFDLAIQSSPPAANALFLELGDFMHIDNQTGTTSRSGHVLPHDFPMNKLMKVAVRAYNVVIHKLAEKYENVKVIVVDGNHNDNGSKWASNWLSYVYQDFKNVVIDDTEDSYYCHKFGDVSIFAHHGHIKKMGNIQEVLVSKFRDTFGSTKKSYCHLGHYHHIQSKETNLMVMEQHRTLAASDNHASQGGYSSGRSATVITYHKELGEVSRATISRDCII